MPEASGNANGQQLFMGMTLGNVIVLGGVIVSFLASYQVNAYRTGELEKSIARLASVEYVQRVDESNAKDIADLTTAQDRLITRVDVIADLVSEIRRLGAERGEIIKNIQDDIADLKSRQRSDLTFPNRSYNPAVTKQPSATPQ